MKKLIIASAFALSAALSFAPATQAANLTIQLGNSHHGNRGDDVVIGRDHGHHRDHDRRHHGKVVRHHDNHNRCRTKKVITHRHGKRIVHETKVCG